MGGGARAPERGGLESSASDNKSLERHQSPDCLFQLCASDAVAESVFSSNPQFLRGVNEFYWVLLGFTAFYWVLLGFTGFYWVLLGLAGFCWVLLGFTGFYWVLLRSTGYYWVLLGFTGFYWVLN